METSCLRFIGCLKVRSCLPSVILPNLFNAEIHSYVYFAVSHIGCHYAECRGTDYLIAVVVFKPLELFY
jgi:hypothetical protein